MSDLDDNSPFHSSNNFVQGELFHRYDHKEAYKTYNYFKNDVSKDARDRFRKKITDIRYNIRDID